MRALPLCLLSEKDMEADCRLSNPSLVSIECVLLYRQLYRSGTIGHALKIIDKYQPQTKEVKYVFGEMETDNILDICGIKKGWTHGLPAMAVGYALLF